MLFPHYLAHLLVLEKGHLPVVKVEAFWKILIVGLLEARNISQKRNHGSFSILLLLIAVLHKDAHLDRTASSSVRLKLRWCVLYARVLKDVYEEDHDRLEGLREQFIVREHLVFFWTIAIT